MTSKVDVQELKVAFGKGGSENLEREREKDR
jgi:hypothetical protein